MERFSVGRLVKKRSGSQWRGRIVGSYSTDLTPRGFVVESWFETGSVQVYPEVALETWWPTRAEVEWKSDGKD
jgi:dihydrofolate reductase (trimethoprim resistance protein)